MSAVVDLVGQRYGKLIVLSRAENNEHKKARWLCQCDCGNQTIVVTGQLNSGRTQSCGCVQRERTKEYNRQNKVTHGKYNHPLHGVWSGMKKRCLCKTSDSYEWYGERGISVCDEWRDSFEKFYTWSIENGYKPGLEIDRIDVNGNYEPSNCRFVPCIVNQRNRRNNIRYNGISISQYCDEHGIDSSMVYQRLRAGWDIEEALHKPKKEAAEAALNKKS